MNHPFVEPLEPRRLFNAHPVHNADLPTLESYSVSINETTAYLQHSPTVSAQGSVNAPCTIKYQWLDTHYFPSSDPVAFGPEEHFWKSSVLALKVTSAGNFSFPGFSKLPVGAAIAPNGAEHQINNVRINIVNFPYGIQISQPVLDEIFTTVNYTVTLPPPSAFSVNIAHVPRAGAWGTYLTGTVSGPLDNDIAVAVFIKVNGVWWPKPFYSSASSPAYQPKVHVAANGHWRCLVTTGGDDAAATEFRAYVVLWDEYADNSGHDLPDPTDWPVFTDVLRP